MKTTSKVSKRAARLVLLFLALFIAAGCVPKYKGPLLLYPGQTESKGYSTRDSRLVFENKDILVTVRQITSSNELRQPVTSSNGSRYFVIDDLVDLDFILIQLEIENRTKKHKILFNPALVSLRDDKTGYRTPLDYTDFYQRSQTEKGFPEDISKMPKIFYDLTAVVPGGKKGSKILVFDQVEEGSDRAELVIKNLYVGRDSMDLTFPFILKPMMSEKDEERQPVK